MTLKTITSLIESIASKQPAVNMIVRNDVFRLNACPSARYGTFAWLQRQHLASVDSNVIRYGFTFFYVDRLTSNHDNEVEIQSVGVQVLDNIIRELDARGVYADGEYIFQSFNQRFADECAGVFVTVNLAVPLDFVCYEEFGDSVSNKTLIY